MRVVQLMGPRLAQRERRLLSRLGVGLADEGVGVVRAVPRSVPALAGEPVGMFETRVTYADTGLPFTTGLRAGALAGEVLRAAPADQARVQVVHCWGERTWAMGRALARELSAALVLELWRTGLASRAGRMLAAERKAGRAAARARFMVVAPDPAIADECAAAGLADCVHRAQWGTHPDESAHWEPGVAGAAGGEAGGEAGAPDGAEAPSPGGVPCSVVLLVPVRSLTSADAASIRAALQGLAVAARAIPELLVFADADSPSRSAVWRWAMESGLRERFTLQADLEGQRALALRSDALVLPCAAGEQRSFVLDAMADGVLVIAARDAANAALTSETALLVSGGRSGGGGAVGAGAPGSGMPTGPHAWADALVGLITDRERSASLRASARRVVLADRRASAHVRAVVECYEQLAYRVGMTQGLSDTEATRAAAAGARGGRTP